MFWQCRLLVTCNDADQAKDSFKCRTALKYKIPVVSFDFLNECVKEARWVDPEPFFVVGETRSQLLHRGLISSCSKFYFLFIVIVILYNTIKIKILVGFPLCSSDRQRFMWLFLVLFLSECIFHCFKSMFLYFSVNASYFCHCYCVVNWHYS